ncbi:MAG: adenylate/guanylate cyclase domain-containing protein [Chloroflexi bacterium]|nr:adenylate/guanylate cyclase domain-containing protein [Chloroflexota bacterium]
MQPQIQYAKTSDGVNIAYWTLGEGSPLVYLPNLIWSHGQLEWQIPEIRRWYEQLAERRTLVRLDPRGTGSSQRDIENYTLEAIQFDIEAVVDRLELDTFALFGDLNAGSVAIRYAANHPDRVAHLILWHTYARVADVRGPKWNMLESLQARMDQDWESYTETRAHMGFGWSDGESAHRYAKIMRDCTTPEMALKAYDAAREDDVTALLPRISSPTLVLHRRELYFWDVQASQNLAATIPDSRLVVLEGVASAPFLGDSDAVVAAIRDFLGEDEHAGISGGFATILFTDVEGSTPLTQRLGDAKARELLREHERMVREALKAHGGSEVKTMGDGFMASFSSATRALKCAIAIQTAFAERNESAEEPIKVRIGLNAGEPIAEDEDLFGTAVNMAARICAHADAGQILAPIVVRELVAGKGFLLSDQGETEMRGFEDPVRLYDVRWRE